MEKSGDDYYFDFEQSWIDPMTNTSFLKGIDPITITNIILKRQLPTSVLWSFIHESTHHWCFDTHYGNLIFMLRIKALLQSRAWEQRAKNDSQSTTNLQFDLLRSQLQYKGLIEVYRPLAEGMAIFAEYDCFPTETELIPTNLVQGSLLFSKEDYYTSEGRQKISKDFPLIEENFKHLLYTKRISKEGVDRKAALFSQKLETRRMGMYMVGYLFVKKLQRVLVARSEKFIDSNLFLSFIRNYFFSESGLVVATLDSDVADENVAASIAQNFANRVFQLQSLPSTLIDDFERNGRSMSTSRENINILVGNDVVDRSNELLNEMDEDIEGVNTAFYNSLVFRRAFFKVALIEVFITIKDKVNVFTGQPVDGLLDDSGNLAFLMSFGNNRNHLPYSGQGYVESYLSFRDSRQVYVILDDSKKMIHIEYGPGWSEEERSKFGYPYAFDVSIDGAVVADTIAEVMNEFISTDSTMKLIYQSAIEGVVEAMQLFYTETAVTYGQANIDEILTAMRSEGFNEILEDDAELIRLFAYISSCSAFHIFSKEHVAALALSCQVEYSQANVDRLIALLNSHGFVFFKQTDSNIVVFGA